MRGMSVPDNAAVIHHCSCSIRTVKMLWWKVSVDEAEESERCV